MFGLDTNVLVRPLTQDDPRQSRIASSLLADLAERGETIFLSGIVLCELCWVLRSAYEYEKNAISEVLEKILDTPQLSVEDRDLVRQALSDYRDGKGDFSDYLLARRAEQAGATLTYSFDRKLKGARLFKVLG